MGGKILVVDDDPDLADIIVEILSNAGYVVDKCLSPLDAEQRIASESYDAVFSDIHMPGKSGLQLLQDLVKNASRVPPFVFVSGNADPAIVDRAARLGAADVIQKPFQAQDLLSALDRLQSRSRDKIYDLMEMVKGISGITLGEDKRALVETRLLRRTRQLSLDSIDEYYAYFDKNRDAEVSELVSLITTHTTQFFRESGHYDYLTNVAFPRLLAAGRKEIRIWSAASSSGEEAYSLAMCYLEFLRDKGLDASRAPTLKVLGSDIDFNVVDQARKGIYPKQSIERVNKKLVERYFDSGSGSLARWVKVKNAVHDLCEFRQLNLIGRSMPGATFDIIFLRNVLIYFKPDVIKKIVSSLEECLGPDGLLILGHSESLAGLDLPFEVVGNSIYAATRCKSKNLVSPSPVALAQPVTPSLQLKTRVFIIDDSATIRRMLRALFSADPSFEVVGEAAHPQAITIPLNDATVDVVTLDIHMPVQDGISYLRSIQGREHPPIVMISSVNYEDGVDYMNCLELGAVDYIEKPSGQDLSAEGERIRVVVKAAAKQRNLGAQTLKKISAAGDKRQSTYKADALGRDLIVLGASTGGTEAIRTVLQGFPAECPPVVIVQHIPEGFSKMFAQRLSSVCPMAVSEAVHGESLKQNHAYIAPGGKHLRVVNVGGRLQIEISDDPPVNRHRPSVDVLFESVVSVAKAHRVSAALLTGMGADGAIGLLALKNAGCHTVAQDEETSVVFGMPKAAIDLGGASEVVPLQSIAYHLFKPFSRRVRAAS